MLLLSIALHKLKCTLLQRILCNILQLYSAILLSLVYFIIGNVLKSHSNFIGESKYSICNLKIIYHFLSAYLGIVHELKYPLSQ